MANSETRKRMIENELLVREANERAKRVIEEHTPVEEQDELAIDFYCECSAIDCQKRVQLTLTEYKKLHERQDRFVIAHGHESPTVEKIVGKQHSFLIVEKYALPA